MTCRHSIFPSQIRKCGGRVLKGMSGKPLLIAGQESMAMGARHVVRHLGHLRQSRYCIIILASFIQTRLITTDQIGWELIQK